MSREYIRTEVASQKEKIKKAEETIDLLQGQCPHETSVYENCGSTGHYDRDDSYWRQFFCYDCGARWTGDQGRYSGPAQEVKHIDYKAKPREIELQRELAKLKAER